MKTSSVTPATIQNNWVMVDASGQTVGRLASEIARILRGKHKANFVPHLDCGDFVVVTNAEKVVLTGKKWSDKIYYNHSGYVGGLKSIDAQDLLKKDPTKIFTNAVKGMMPKNKLARHQFKKLKVYAGVDHPHTAQKPVLRAPNRLAGV